MSDVQIFWLVNRQDGFQWRIDEIKPDHSVKITRPRTEAERFRDHTIDDRMGWLTPLQFQFVFGVTIYDLMGMYI